MSITPPINPDNLAMSNTNKPVSWLISFHRGPDNKVHGANMGPTGSCRPQMGPMLTPWTLRSGRQNNIFCVQLRVDITTCDLGCLIWLNQIIGVYADDLTITMGIIQLQLLSSLSLFFYQPHNDCFFLCVPLMSLMFCYCHHCHLYFLSKHYHCY